MPLHAKEETHPHFGLSPAFLAVLFASVVFGAACTEDQSEEAITEIGSPAEWLPARRILMHTPGEELFLGVVHPAAALYEEAFDVRGAGLEHRAYIEALRRRGVRVDTVVETLLAGTTDPEGQALPGAPLDALRELAARFLIYDTAALPPEIADAQAQYRTDTINALSPAELVQIILTNPTVHLTTTPGNTGFDASYDLSPVMNLYFCRDQMITTAKGVVLSRMNSDQRARETDIMKFVLAKLDVTPIYEVTGDGRLEGGDFLPAGETAFIGQGLRTNAEAVKQLLEQAVFGATRVVVVKDARQDQSQMHLDTFFNIIAPDLAVLVASRIDTPEKTVDDLMRLKVDVYEMDADGYQPVLLDGDFQDYLEDVLGFTLIPVSDQDQLDYGINFLTVASGQIMAVDGVSEAYTNDLTAHGVDIEWIDFTNLTGGYGAAHCTTQVLSRR